MAHYTIDSRPRPELCYRERVHADLEFRSIPRMALLNADRFGDEVAVIDGDLSLSFREVSDRMLAIGRALLANGIEPGDRVALWAPNSAGWITAALGILATGARLVPLNTRFKGQEAAYILNKCGAGTLLTVDGFLGFDYLDMVRRADPSVPALRDAVILDGPSVDGASSWSDFLARGSEVDEAAIRERIESIRAEDSSDVLFTSGTTGHPKGVMLRHGTSLRCYSAYNETLRLGRGDRVLIVTPFFHCFGYKAGWMAALMVGATAVPMAVFDPAAALRMVEELRITHTGGAPTMFWAMIEDPTRPDRDLSSLQRAIVSAAYVPVELVERMKSDLGIEQPLTGYGLTEAHAIVSKSQPDEAAEIVANWSGRVLDDVEVRIVDEGRDMPLGERGELLVRGYNLMDGYFDDPEATAAVIDADGWLHTGDIAYLNADNYLKVCDRKKDMYVTGGFNVAPAEVESIIAGWDRVSACAVVGIADHKWGEVGSAFVVPMPGAVITPDEVIAYARSQMANYKVPRQVSIVDELPLNATGKVLKQVLRDRLGEAGPLVP
jgi:acyl-CoA synthetase (AMP-forming)/AMP-acid ligase II